jgi:tRNA(fMet)-specific endonuclease VapC
MFLLDTDICSAYLKRRRGITHRFIQHSGRLHTTAVVLGELYTWAHRRTDPTPTIQAIETELLPQVGVLNFDISCAAEFGRLRAALMKQGRPVDAVDLQIAATALTHDLTLVTHNQKDYLNIPDLRVEDWLHP